MEKLLIVYQSFSGNTKEVADLIVENLGSKYEIDTYRILYSTDSGKFLHTLPNYDDYDLIMFGTFTWGKGELHNHFKEFIRVSMTKKPNNVAVFGTGDTQFGGDDLFCYAVDKLHKFFNVKYPPLKIEQSPRGSQEPLIREWCENF